MSSNPVLISRFREKISSLYLEKTKEKTTVKKRPLFVSFIFLVLSIATVNLLLSRKKGKSIVATSNNPLYSEKSPEKEYQTTVPNNPDTDHLFENSSNPKRKKRIRENKKSIVLISYKKKQVLFRNDQSHITIPAGKKIIAKLLNSIDTRTPSNQVLAIIPFAVKYKQRTVIPKNSTLFGKFYHDGKSERIFINFTKCDFPDGMETIINAQALDSKDFQVGIKAIHHSKGTTRISKSIALGMISPMAQTLTQKEALGQGFIITPKSNLKNAFLQGLAESSEGESKRQIKEIGGDKDYLTLAGDKEIIVNLLTPFKQGKKNL